MVLDVASRRTPLVPVQSTVAEIPVLSTTSIVGDISGNRKHSTVIITGAQAGLSRGMWQCVAPLPTRTWKLQSAAGAAAELAASNKVVKYAGLSSQGEFVPIAVESHGPINRDALQFLSELGKGLVETTGDFRASSFLFQRISVWAGATI